ncbi:LOW QUALITY PROTEIN: hypothetical protein OSB04_004252 [Centaurea solstitialis]|uniref:Uncharacterized protein n=1 Tax=Centaurea solstitialis TaxID=347529 RepID=A0AA38U6W5_9ASTR|nr:LOW QUALITY PROTEIN: hypothetical protein OSB04_004252 [Centaurea solstitialis]
MEHIEAKKTFLNPPELYLSHRSLILTYNHHCTSGLRDGAQHRERAVENWHRFTQDVKVNARKVMVHGGDGVFVPKPWMKVEVGDVVKVEKDHFFLVIYSCYPLDGVCYVETINLDRETNLKVKRCLEVTLPLDNDQPFKCEDPNPNLYTFVGNFEYNSQTHPLDPTHILLRDSKLRNTVMCTGWSYSPAMNQSHAKCHQIAFKKEHD